MSQVQEKKAQARVFVFSGQTLLGQGIEDLLRQDGNLDVVSEETDPDRALGSIAAVHPDVVILVGDSAAADYGAAVMRILKQGWTTRVVEVNLETNVLHIYGKEEWLVREVKDLLEAIERLVGRDI